MVVKDGKTLYRVQYKVQEGDTPINMRASVESLEDLHRMLCSMDGFRTRRVSGHCWSCMRITGMALSLSFLSGIWHRHTTTCMALVKPRRKR